MDNIKDEQMKKILSEFAEKLIHVYGKHLKQIILYGSMARGVSTKVFCMPLDTQTLCGYRLERAQEDLLTTEYNHQSGFYKASINRSYYAIFHSFQRRFRNTVEKCKIIS